MENQFLNGATPERNFSDIISHAFNTYLKVIIWGIALLLIAWIISALASAILSPLTGFHQSETQIAVQDAVRSGNYNDVYLKVLNTPGYKSTIGISYLINLLLFPLYAGFMYILQKGQHGQPAHFRDLFIGYRQNTLQIILYGLISGVIMAVSAMLCFFPYLFVTPLLLIGLPVVFFENTTAIEGVKKSFSIGTKNYGTFFAVSLISFIVAILGVLFCVVGLVATIPFMFAAMYSTYCAFCGTPTQIKS